MPIQSIFIVSLFYLMNGPFCDLLDLIGTAPEWIGFIDYTILFAVFLGLEISSRGTRLRKFKPKKESIWRYLLETILIMAASYLLVNLIVVLCDQLFAINILPQNTERLKENTGQLPKWASFLMMTIYAPFIEELVFRESLIGWPDKSNKKNITIMAIISIFAFDLIHIIHIREFLYYLPLSLALSWIYLRNDRQLPASMIAHSLTNFVAFILIISGSL